MQSQGTGSPRANAPRTSSADRRTPSRLLAPLLATLTLVLLAACNGGFGGPAAGVAPAITLQPASLSVLVGQTATFTVAATGTAPLTYQWLKNGTAIAGATTVSYTTPAAAITDTGSKFTVTVSNAFGSVTSAAAILTVNTVPVATSLACAPLAPPYNSVAALVPTFSGGTATIGSTGTSSSDITAAAVSGTSYTSPALTSAKTYTLTVTGTALNTATATCTVTPTAVTLTPISPAGVTIPAGTQTFTTTAAGGLTNTVKWSASAGTFAANVWTTPSTAGTYTITATSVDNPAVFVTTTATVTPVTAPVITTQPVAKAVCPGATATFSVVATNGATYQWNLAGTPIAGATSATYTIPAAAASQAGSYTVTVTNPGGSVTSTPATLTVGSTITSNPASITVATTQTATFSVAVTGNGPFTYQWYGILIPLGSLVPAPQPEAVSPRLAATLIVGATSSVYTTPTVNGLFVSGSQYFVVVTDACGNAITSTPATVTIVSGNVPPTITTQPVGVTVAAGGTPSFSVVASGSPTLTYQWYRIPAGTTGSGSIVNGATSATYTLPASSTTTANDQDVYYVMVSNPYGQAVSQNATLSVGSGILIQIGNEPLNQYINVGATGTFSVTATSTLPLTYQWYKAPPGSSTFTAISGATAATYTTPAGALTDNGSVFYVTVSNGSTTAATSTSAALFVGPLAGIANFCSSTWSPLGTAILVPGSAGTSCTASFQLTAATGSQHGEIVWPTLISTGNIQLSFTVTVSNPSSIPADGFAMVLGDPSLGATPFLVGAPGLGLGAEGIPGFVLGFDDYENAGDPPVPYLGIGRGETALWESPWTYVNTNIPALATPGATVTHNYTVSIVHGQMTVSLDGSQVFSGSVSVPPVAYFYMTGSTGLFYEQTVISNLTATVSAP